MKSSWLHKDFHINFVRRQHFLNGVLLGSVLATENSAANNTVARPSIRSGQGFPAIFPHTIGSNRARVWRQGDGKQSAAVFALPVSYLCLPPARMEETREKRGRLRPPQGTPCPELAYPPPNEAVLKNSNTCKKIKKIHRTSRCCIFKPNSNTPCRRTVSLTTTTYGEKKTNKAKLHSSTTPTPTCSRPRRQSQHLELHNVLIC